jgi:hypothetical protein
MKLRLKIFAITMSVFASFALGMVTSHYLK